MVSEVVQVQAKAAIVLEQDDGTHLREVLRLAVGRETHDLVFVAVLRKAEVLGQRLVEDSEGVGKVDPLFQGDVFAGAGAPCRAGKIAEAVDGDDGCRAERRDQERRSQMGEVVLDMMHVAAERLSGARRSEQRGDSRPFLLVLQAIENQPDVGAIGEGEPDLPPRWPWRPD